jgi:hypothetical protein
MIRLRKEERVWIAPVRYHVQLLDMIAKGEITRQGAREVLDWLWEHGHRLCSENGIGFR